MHRKSTTILPWRPGELLRIGREVVPFGRNIVRAQGLSYEVQHRFFVNEPWELIAEATHRAVPEGRIRDIAHSFRRQAEDYFQAATVAVELAVRPVLLYYAFLNLAKVYAISRGNAALAGRASHGIAIETRHRAIPGSLIKFDDRHKPAMFHELLQLFGGNSSITSAPLKLGNLLPQILPGHRLWCYATGKRERFVSIESFELMHLQAQKAVWLNIYARKSDLERLSITGEAASREANLKGTFHLALSQLLDTMCFQQHMPTLYTADPGESLVKIIEETRNNLWETVKVASPYRKPYIYCCPTSEHQCRLPQLLSIYLLMFFLSSVTRYSPGYFEELLESKYGPFFDTFISESPLQFLYLMASELLGREVSKPAII